MEGKQFINYLLLTVYNYTAWCSNRSTTAQGMILPEEMWKEIRVSSSEVSFSRRSTLRIRQAYFNLANFDANESK